MDSHRPEKDTYATLAPRVGDGDPTSEGRSGSEILLVSGIFGETRGSSISLLWRGDAIISSAAATFTADSGGDGSGMGTAVSGFLASLSMWRGANKTFGRPEMF